MFVCQILTAQVKVHFQGVVVASDLAYRAAEFFDPRNGLGRAGRRAVGNHGDDRRWLSRRLLRLGLLRLGLLRLRLLRLGLLGRRLLGGRLLGGRTAGDGDPQKACREHG